MIRNGNAVTLRYLSKLVTAALLALSLFSVIGSVRGLSGTAPDFTAESSTAQPELTMKYDWTVGSDVINGTFTNGGNVAIEMNLARVFIDIVPAELAGNCSEAPLTPSQTCAFSITPGFSNSLIAPGSGHSLDIVEPNGEPFWFTVFYSTSPVYGNQESASSVDLSVGGSIGIVLVAADWTSVVILKLLIQNVMSTPVNLAASSWRIGIWTGPNSMETVEQTDVTYDSFSVGSSVSSLLPGGAVIVTIRPNEAFTPGVINLGEVYWYLLYINLPDGSRVGFPCCTPGQAFPPTLQYTSTATTVSSPIQTTMSSQTVSLAKQGIFSLVADGLVLIVIISILGLIWIVASVLRSRRKSLGHIRAEEGEIVLQNKPQRDEIPMQPQEIKRKCRYCGAEVGPERLICDKCGMPAGYL